MKSLSKEELQGVKDWIEKQEGQIPSEVKATLVYVLGIITGLTKAKTKAQDTVKRLREAMGILPKSERGKTDKPFEVDLTKLSLEDQQKYQEISQKRRKSLNEAAKYARALKAIRPTPIHEQLELPFSNTLEVVFSSKSSDRIEENKKEKVNRMKEFGKELGLHSTTDSTKRVDLQIRVTETIYNIETVTDPHTGKTVRASMDHIGPSGLQFTWRAIANLIKLVIGFAIPMNRLATIIGEPEFESGKIYRTLEWAASGLLPVYFCLFEQISDAQIISGDDTKAKVLNLGEVGEDTLAKKIEDRLGWQWPKADGSGSKKSLNMSLLIGRSDQLDPKSTIRFFRTHLGSVGNLLTSLLEHRSPKAGPLIFQGDLSTTNLPLANLQKMFSLLIAGCAAHARRPFWRYREEDGLFCYFMLRGFLVLSRLEKRIDAKGRNEKNILHFRGRYGRKIWEALKNRCIAATTGKSPGRYTLKDAESADIWPPGHELHVAANYVINHFAQLTLYLSNPHLKYTNNDTERALRIEKAFLSGSKFTRSRNGRAVTDILRTINATCTAVGLDLADYLRYVFTHRSQLEASPEKFTPYAVAIALAKEKKIT